MPWSQNIQASAKGPLSGLAIGPMFKDEKALDATSVEVDLTQPWAAFPSSFLDGGSAYMMAPSQIAAGTNGTLHPVGTGPFAFDSWSQNEHVQGQAQPELLGRPRLERRPPHRSPLPRLDRVPGDHRRRHSHRRPAER